MFGMQRMPNEPDPVTKSTEAELIAVRREKLARLRELGVNPFGERFETDHEIGDLRAGFKEGVKVRIAGRITAHRDMGKSHCMRPQQCKRLLKKSWTNIQNLKKKSWERFKIPPWPSIIQSFVFFILTGGCFAPRVLVLVLDRPFGTRFVNLPDEYFDFATFGVFEIA